MIISRKMLSTALLSLLLLMATSLIAIERLSAYAVPPIISQPELQLAPLNLLCEKTLSFRFYNPNWTTVQIVDCRGVGCNPGGCIKGIEPEAFSLAPGETKEVKLQYVAPHLPGPFEREFIFYSETSVLNEHKVKICGIANFIENTSNSGTRDAIDDEGEPGENQDGMAIVE